jgi:hypothetical protein
MPHRIRPPVPLRVVLSAGLLLTLSLAAHAAVQVRADTRQLTRDQTLQLTLTADTPGQPDLSPLEQDFVILGRSSSTSRHTSNGRTRQYTTLRLTLLPRREGELHIPAIRVGEQHSAPLTIRVAPAGDGSGQDAGQNTGQNTGPPGGALPGGPYFPLQGFGPAPEPGDWYAPPGGGWPAPSGAPPAVAPQPAPAAPEPAATPVRDPGYWPWLAAFAGAGWILTSLALVRRHRPRNTAPATLAAAPAPAPDRAAPEAAVARACRQGDPFAARAALLHWGAALWPGDPPGNLSRLAARCPAPLQRHLLELETALYSPDPRSWNDPALAEALQGFNPAPVTPK